MLIKPPAPASFGPNFETLRFPVRPPAPSPRNATSRPPPSVIELELVAHVQDGLRIGRSAEIKTSGRNAPDHARLRGERNQVGNFLFGRDGGNALRHPDAKIDRDAAVRLYFHRRSPGDDLPFAELKRLKRCQRHTDFMRKERWIIRRRKSLHVVPGPGYFNNAIRHEKRGLNFTRRGLKIPLSAIRSTWAITISTRVVDRHGERE